MKANLKFLGTGPKGRTFNRPDCDTEVCKIVRKKGKKTKNYRTQTSAVLNYKGKNLLINISQDIRKQFKRQKIKNIDAAVITHGHMDCIGGIFRLKQMRKGDEKLPVFAEEKTWDRIEEKFSKGTLSFVEKHKIKPYKAFELWGLKIVAGSIPHSRKPEKYPTIGLKIENNFSLFWAEDTSAPTHKKIPKKTAELIKGSDLIIYDAAMGKERQIFNHNTLNEELINKLEEFGAKKVLFTQLGVTVKRHEDAVEFVKKINNKFGLSYDGLKVDLTDLKESQDLEGLYLVEPHASMISSGVKKLIVKSRPFKNMVGRKLLLLGKDRVYGVIILKRPRKIDLDEFAKLKTKHKISERERKKWWPDKKELFVFDFKFRPHQIKAADIPRGTQTFVKPENINIKENELLFIENLINAPNNDIEKVSWDKATNAQVRDDVRILVAWVSTKIRQGDWQ